MCKYWLHHSWVPKQGIIPACELNDIDHKQITLNFMAIDAYIYGYPLVLVNVTKKMMLASGLQINHFLNERVFPTSQYTTIIRPNVDTLYSMAWLDLSREPLILYVPDTNNRYYLMELLDAWTNVFTSIGARTTGTGPGAFAITGPQWNGMLPKDTSRIGAPTNTVWVIGRTQTNGETDYPIVHAIQNKYNLISLSDWKGIADCNENNSRTKSPNITPVNRVATMDAASFFQTMMEAAYLDPPWIEDPSMNKRLTMLGLLPTKAFNFFNLAPAVQQALANAVKYGPQLIKSEAKKESISNNSNGWKAFFKSIGFYGANYLQRAIVGMTGIGANLPQDSVYYPAASDNTGRPLMGYNNYIIHFAKNHFPPNNAFWSITAYTVNGYLVDNAINRYAVSSHLSKLNYNIDGSLDIFVGNVPPGKADVANWLPTPEGSFNLVLRIYWPKQSVLSGHWTPPAIIRS